MKKVILYIATSIDGKIARENGSVDWLELITTQEGEDYGYAEFYNSIDTTLMGNKTFQQVLSFPVDFPYPDKNNFVFTRSKEVNISEHAEIIRKDPVEFVRALKQEEGKNIWLVGGAEINGLLLQHKLIDEIILFKMPVVIGSGISLFGEDSFFELLKLEETKTYNSGVVKVVYTT